MLLIQQLDNCLHRLYVQWKLQERVEDIPLLADRFLAEISEQWNGEKMPEISAAAMDTLKHHNYTGNVRELINILQRAITMCEGNVIQPADLLLEHVEMHDSPPAEAEKQDDESLDSYMEGIEKKMLEDVVSKDAISFE